MKDKFYITTPIYYPSGNFHIGHCYCTVIADVIAKYNRLAGKDVFFLTGTDEHGQKIEKKAIEKGVTPKEYVDKIVNDTKILWEVLGISYDRFIRTTDEDHKLCVQKIFNRLYEQGDIYLNDYEGYYCRPCESFFTETQLNDGKCPDCNREVQLVKEEGYFFRLSKYGARLKEFFVQNPDFLLPETRKNEMFASFIDQGLSDIFVTRNTFDWGIKVPFDPKHVIYVWIDALSNYITALGYLSEDDSKFKKFWPADLHLVGKEITRFHAIIWPALLMALDLPMPKRVFGHGWLVIDGQKISKSFNNYKDPREYIKYTSVDALRYYLLKEVKLGQDANFSEDIYIQRINSDLANDLGNLVSRTISMTEKYSEGVLKKSSYENNEDNISDIDLISLTKLTIEKYNKNFENNRPDIALDVVMRLVGSANKYIDINEPWNLAKFDDKKERLEKVLYTLSEVIRIVAILLRPYMNDAPEKIFTQLGINNLPHKDELKTYESIEHFGVIPENTVCKKTENIFPRIDASKVGINSDEKKEQEVEMEEKKIQEAENKANLISIDEFAKVELRVAQITEVERVENSDKLYKLTVDLGFEKRTVVSGIVLYYSIEELKGRKIVLVSNLKPAKLRGIESNGMLLAAGDGDLVKILSVDESIENGTLIH